MIKNVGIDHNDLHSRIGAVIVMLLLVFAGLPLPGHDHARVTIALLAVSMIGVLGLGFGMVFGRKNIVAGLIIMNLPLIVYFFAPEERMMSAVICAGTAAIYLISTLITRKCIFNRVFHINSVKKSPKRSLRNEN